MNKRPNEESGLEVPNKRRELDVEFGVPEVERELEIMRHSTDANVLVKGCVNLWQMAADPNMRKALASTNALQLILTTMNSNINHIGIVTVGLNALCCILGDQNTKIVPAHNKQIEACGGLDAILDIVKKHINNEFVCKRACELLTIFASDPANEQAKRGIYCALEMMHAHLADGEVQFSAFGLLGAFPLTDFKRPVVEEVLTSVLGSLQENRQDVAVQWKGLVLLRKLTKNKYGGLLMLQKGAVHIIMRALRTFQAHDMICERGFQILQCLSSEGPPFASDVAIHGGLTVIIGALKCHTNSGTVQLYGCRLLYTILRTDIHHPHLKGGVESVLAAMRTFTYDVEIQEYACAILAILADQEDYRTLILIEGGVDLLLVAMKTHLISVSINVDACKTLSNLHMLREVCRERQVLEVMECVLLAMRVHQSVKRIQQHACDLLELLADIHLYKQQIILRGGRACVKTAIFTVGLERRNLLQKLSTKTYVSSHTHLRPNSDSEQSSFSKKYQTEFLNHFNATYPSYPSSLRNENNNNNNNNNTTKYINIASDTDDEDGEVFAYSDKEEESSSTFNPFTNFNATNFTSPNFTSRVNKPLPSLYQTNIPAQSTNSNNDANTSTHADKRNTQPPSNTTTFTTSSTTTSISTTSADGGDNGTYTMDVDFP